MGRLGLHSEDGAVHDRGYWKDWREGIPLKTEGNGTRSREVNSPGRCDRPLRPPGTRVRFRPTRCSLASLGGSSLDPSATPLVSPGRTPAVWAKAPASSSLLQCVCPLCAVYPCPHLAPLPTLLPRRLPIPPIRFLVKGWPGLSQRGQVVVEI